MQYNQTFEFEIVALSTSILIIKTSILSKNTTACGNAGIKEAKGKEDWLIK